MKWRSLPLQQSSPDTDARTLREILLERKQLMAKYVPAETQAVHARAIQEVKDKGIADRALSVGDRAPTFELNDQRGKLVSLVDLLGQGGVVICFIRGRWDPFCCGQMEAMNQVLPQIVGADASFVAISPQTVQQSFFMADQHKLRFPLLSDSRNAVARQFGLVNRVPEYQEAIYRRALINLPFINGEDSWELPIPATYILNREGIVVFASVNPNYMERPEPGEILQRLRENSPRW